MSLKSDFRQCFHDLIHVYTPGAWAVSPRGHNFDVNRKALSLYPFVASLKKNVFEVIIQSFHDLIHVYSPGKSGRRGGGGNFDVNRTFLSLQAHKKHCRKMKSRTYRKKNKKTKKKKKNRGPYKCLYTLDLASAASGFVSFAWVGVQVGLFTTLFSTYWGLFRLFRNMGY